MIFLIERKTYPSVSLALISDEIEEGPVIKRGAITPGKRLSQNGKN